MKDEEIRFITKARSMCSKNPKLLGVLIQAATDGIDDQVRIANERAGDFEVIAASMRFLAKEKRIDEKTIAHYNNLICQKISKWQDKSALNWSNE